MSPGANSGAHAGAKVHARVLLVEPDERGGAIIERTLAALGCAVERVGALAEARTLQEERGVDAALVDELAGDSPLADVRALREHHPRVPVLVTGTLLSARTLRELLQLGCAGALPKPFTPAELRELVSYALRSSRDEHADALDFAAALTDARAQILAGDPRRARALLRRAHRAAPLDPAAARLEALCAELLGEDLAADRYYRASIALDGEPSTEGPDAYEALSRLALYALHGLSPVAELAAAARELPRVSLSECDGAQPCVLVAALSLAAGTHARYYRQGPRVALELHAGEAPRERTEIE